MYLKDEEMISYYVNQFGIMFSSGKGYLKLFVLYYVKNNYVMDIDDFIVRVSRNAHVQPASIIKAIRRFLNKSWERGFAWEWNHYVNWNESYPPHPYVAIHLLCQYYIWFVCKYENLLEKCASYYIRLSVERLENPK